MLDELITGEEIMKVLGLTQEQLDALRQKGLKGMRVGRGKWVFLQQDVIDFFKKQIRESSETSEE